MQDPQHQVTALDLTLSWVPGHEGIHGKNNAGEEANAAKHPERGSPALSQSSNNAIYGDRLQPRCPTNATTSRCISRLCQLCVGSTQAADKEWPISLKHFNAPATPNPKSHSLGPAMNTACVPVQKSTTEFPGNDPKIGLLHLPNFWGGRKGYNPSSVHVALTPSIELFTSPCWGAVNEYSNRCPRRMRRITRSSSLLTERDDSANSLERFAWYHSSTFNAARNERRGPRNDRAGA